jgi:hypothetical protein
MQPLVPQRDAGLFVAGKATCEWLVSTPTLTYCVFARHVATSKYAEIGANSAAPSSGRYLFALRFFIEGCCQLVNTFRTTDLVVSAPCPL